MAERLPVTAPGDAPRRIQRQRTRGWRMPPNTVYVGRGSRWGNPFTTAAAIESGYTTPARARAFVVGCFRDWLGNGHDWWQGPKSDRCRDRILTGLGRLRGKNLACWCPLLIDANGKPAPCHADVLLEIANADPTPTPEGPRG